MAVLALLLALAAVGPAVSPRHLPPGALADAQGRLLAQGELARRASGVQFVMVGETHSNPCDHLAQARIIEELAVAGGRPTVGLEMVAVDQQGALDLFNQRRIPAERMGEALAWPQFWGFSFELYLPVFRAAERWDLPVVALNAPGYAVHLATRRDIDFDLVTPRDLLPDRLIPPPPGQEESLAEEFQRHGAWLPERPGSSQDPFERFLKAQSIWDSKMAEEALRASGVLERPVVVLAGSGHVEHGWGIPHRLAEFAPGLRALRVLPWRGGQAPDPSAADLFFFCPNER